MRTALDTKPSVFEIFMNDLAIDATVNKTQLSAWTKNISHNEIYGSLIDALSEIYSKVNKLVGENLFRFAASLYIREYPSLTAKMDELGSQFPGFLAQIPLTGKYAFLPDLARLEWAGHESFRALKCSQADFSLLSKVSRNEFAQIKFILNPSVRLLATDYPLLNIWSYYIQSKNNVDMSAEKKRSNFLVFRSGSEIYTTELTAGEYLFLRWIEQKSTFGEACEKGLSIDPGMDVAACVEKYIRAGVIAGWVIENEKSLFA